MDHLNPLHVVNPVAAVGSVLKVGASAAQEVPTKALGLAMGAAGVKRQALSRRHRSGLKADRQAQAAAVADGQGCDQHQAAAVEGSQDSSHSEATAGTRGGKTTHCDIAGPSGPVSPQGTNSPKARQATAGERSGSESRTSGSAAKASGWDKARSAVFQGRVKQSAPESRVSSSQSSRELRRSSASGGTLSKNTTGPMQYIWSRGGKFAATVAMAVNNKKGQQTGTANTSHSRDESDQLQDQQQDQQNQTDDLETGEEEPSGIADNSDKTPGTDAVLKHGAGDPKAAAGGQVNTLQYPHPLMCNLLAVHL